MLGSAHLARQPTLAQGLKTKMNNTCRKLPCAQLSPWFDETGGSIIIRILKSYFQHTCYGWMREPITVTGKKQRSQLRAKNRAHPTEPQNPVHHYIIGALGSSVLAHQVPHQEPLAPAYPPGPSPPDLVAPSRQTPFSHTQYVQSTHPPLTPPYPLYPVARRPSPQRRLPTTTNPPAHTTR